jgi:hypothetical protein
VGLGIPYSAFWLFSLQPPGSLAGFLAPRGLADHSGAHGLGRTLSPDEAGSPRGSPTQSRRFLYPAPGAFGLQPATEPGSSERGRDGSAIRCLSPRAPCSSRPATSASVIDREVALREPINAGQIDVASSVCQFGSQLATPLRSVIKVHDMATGDVAKGPHRTEFDEHGASRVPAERHSRFEYDIEPCLRC